eukprot:2768263-Pleurochrysis_carterae.AAC.6
MAHVSAGASYQRLYSDLRPSAHLALSARALRPFYSNSRVLDGSAFHLLSPSRIISWTECSLWLSMHVRSRRSLPRPPLHAPAVSSSLLLRKAAAIDTRQPSREETDAKCRRSRRHAHGVTAPYAHECWCAGDCVSLLGGPRGVRYVAQASSHTKHSCSAECRPRACLRAFAAARDSRSRAG